MSTLKRTFERLIVVLVCAFALVGVCVAGTIVLCLTGKTRACVIDFKPNGGDMQCQKLTPQGVPKR